MDSFFLLTPTLPIFAYMKLVLTGSGARAVIKREGTESFSSQINTASNTSASLDYSMRNYLCSALFPLFG